MTSLRRQMLSFFACSVAILFCSVVFVGSARADNTPPPDPIIDMEGINSSFAAAQLPEATTNPLCPSLAPCAFTGTFSFVFPTDDCMAFGTNERSCSATLNFVNALNTPINNMEYIITALNGNAIISQGGYSAPAVAPYQVVSQNFEENEAVYAATPASAAFLPGQRFSVNFGEVLVSLNGSATVQMNSNVPVPEPASLAMLVGSVPLFWLRRKKHKI